MARPTPRIQNAACFDQDPNKLPIVAAKGKQARTTMITAVLIDGEKGWFDDAATHGRTPLEQGVEWVSSPDELTGGRRIDIVWLYIKPSKESYTYHGATASHMIIDEAAKKGYKYLADHANQLAKALKGGIDLSGLSEQAKKTLLRVLNTYPDVLENSSRELKEALGIAAPA